MSMANFKYKKNYMGKTLPHAVGRIGALKVD